eukprot:Nitzschia sp. Nitz4//scaffold19_size178191//123170//123723//NITZ4_001994-RA/size178191-augustus-gene-0.153-mRNA-1//-1//CDS//3329540732//7817//frame0
MTDIHARAFNLARRHSVQNENDLMQENFVQDDVKMDVWECSALLKNMSAGTDFEMPSECQQFGSIRAEIQKRNSNREEDNHVAYQGMGPHETLEHIRSKQHNLPSEAKLIRRMTTRSKDSWKHQTAWYWNAK